MKAHHWIAISLLTVMAGCSSSSDEEPPVAQLIPINLSCSIARQETISRTTDYGFEAGDRIGLYVVNYNGSTPGTLQNNGNHVNNMRFTYSDTWTPESPIYWKDEETKADFYLYYPYGTPTTLEAYPFSVKENQSSESNYKASDFLWGKTSGIAPTEKAINITAKHVFSCALIKVKAGNGFTEESLAASQMQVSINGVKTGATVNLHNGTVTATGNSVNIIPLKEDGNYKALIVPQAITSDNLITITIDGREFKLKKDFTFVSGKRHTFTVTVSKTSNGINVNIGNWEDDDTDNGGTAE